MWERVSVILHFDDKLLIVISIIIIQDTIIKINVIKFSIICLSVFLITSDDEIEKGDGTQ